MHCNRSHRSLFSLFRFLFKSNEFRFQISLPEQNQTNGRTLHSTPHQVAIVDLEIRMHCTIITQQRMNQQDRANQQIWTSTELELARAQRYFQELSHCVYNSQALSTNTQQVASNIRAAHHRQSLPSCCSLLHQSKFLTTHGVEVEDQVDLVRHVLWTNETTKSTEILHLLFQVLDLSSYLPSLYRQSHPDERPTTTIDNYDLEGDNTSLLLELCMDSKHDGVSKLLQALPPRVATNELHRMAYVHVDYSMDNDDVKEFHCYQTPFQAAWEGLLYDVDECHLLDSIQEMQHVQQIYTSTYPQQQQLQQLQNSASLVDAKYQESIQNIQNIWQTTFCLLEASNCIPFKTETNTQYNNTVLHTIAKTAHHAHSAIIWFGIHLNPTFLTYKDSNGDLPIHILASNSIYYKSLRSQEIDFNKRRNSGKNDRSTSITTTQDGHHGMVCDNEEEMLHWDEPPIIQVLQTVEGRESASICDADGRLPLHRLLTNHESNHVKLDKIQGFFQSKELGYHHYDNGDNEDDVMMNNDRLDSNHLGYAMDTARVVRELVYAYPYALNCVDPTNGFIPFLKAASTKSIPLDVVYFLLSENLDILAAGYVSSN